MPSRAARTAAWSLGTIPPSNVPSSSKLIGLVGADRRDDVAVDQQPRHICHEEDPLSLEAGGEGNRGLIGVDVERPLRQGSDDRDSTLPKRAQDERGATRQRVTDEAELGDLASLRGRCSSPMRPTARGPIAAQSDALTSASDSRTISSASGVV